MNKEIEIPEGYEARIEGNKVILEPKESDAEKIRKALVKTFEKKLEIGFEWTEFDIPNRSVLDWLEKQKEQQPAEWSEKDEDMLNSIIATCQLAAQDRDSEPAWHLLKMQEKFLKSLPERFNLQPKQEWSEEDKIRLKEALEVLDESIKSLRLNLEKL